MIQMNYTKSLIGFTLAVFMSYSSFAQEEQTTPSNYKNNEIKAQVSDGVPYTFVTGLMNAFGSVANSLVGYDEVEKKSQSIPHLGLGYRYHLNDVVSLGVDIGYQNSRREYTLSSKSNNKSDVHRKKTTQLFLIMPAADFTYLNKKIVKLYGGAAVGVAIGAAKNTYSGGQEKEEKSMGYLPAFQLTPFGIRVGKQVAGYFEVGLGYQGFLTLGLSVTL